MRYSVSLYDRESNKSVEMIHTDKEDIALKYADMLFEKVKRKEKINLRTNKPYTSVTFNDSQTGMVVEYHNSHL